MTASEGEAQKARREHGRELVRRGAHAIGVEPGDRYGRDGYVVIAHVEPGRPAEMPESLTVLSGKRQVEVPVVVEKSDLIVPE